MSSRLRKRGWGPWEQQWYSICSIHSYYNKACNMCTCGHWTNTWKRFCGHIVYTVSPNLWRYFVNKKWWQKLFKDGLDSLHNES